MRHTNHIAAALALFLCAATIAVASEPGSPEGPRPNRLMTPGKRIILMGVYGGAGLVTHSGPFATQEGTYDCCTYDEGSGTGFIAGLKAVIPLETRLFLIPRVAYQSLSGAFDSESFAYPVLSAGNTMEWVEFENQLDITLSATNIGVHAAYMIADFGLYVSAGPSLSYVLSKEFTSTDRITGPPGVRFREGGTEKQVYRGDMNIAQSAFFSLDGSAGALIELSPSIFINPEILYSLPLTALSKERDWKIGRVQGSVGVLLTL